MLILSDCRPIVAFLELFCNPGFRLGFIMNPILVSPPACFMLAFVFIGGSLFKSDWMFTGRVGSNLGLNAWVLLASKVLIFFALGVTEIR